MQGALRNSIAVSCFIFFVSCASVPLQPEPPVKPGMAQVILQRVGNVVFLAGGAKVEINGSQVASLGTHEVYVGDIKPGPTVIAAHGDVISGRYVVNFNAEVGKIYRFKVSPRGDSSGELGDGFVLVEKAGAFQVGSGK